MKRTIVFGISRVVCFPRRAANGLILLAHSKKVASQLALLFEKRKVQKHYCAIVDGCFPDSISNIDIAIDGKPASTIILAGTYDSQKNQSELLVQIETGRTEKLTTNCLLFSF